VSSTNTQRRHWRYFGAATRWEEPPSRGDRRQSATSVAPLPSPAPSPLASPLLQATSPDCHCCLAAARPRHRLTELPRPSAQRAPAPSAAAQVLPATRRPTNPALVFRSYLPFEDPDTSALYGKIMAGEYALPSFLSLQVGHSEGAGKRQGEILGGVGAGGDQGRS
jgi:hypothetical protein